MVVAVKKAPFTHRESMFSFDEKKWGFIKYIHVN